MHALVRTMFSRLHSLNPEEEEARLWTVDEDSPDREIKMSVQTAVDIEEDLQKAPPVPNSDLEAALDMKSLPTPCVDHLQYIQDQFTAQYITNIDLHRQFTINCWASSCQCQCLGSQWSTTHWFDRLIALGILNAALEEFSTCVMEFPSLKVLILDPGPKFLFQLARSDNTAILYSSLRAIATVFDTMRKHLKALSHYATSSRICESLLVLFSLGFRVHILIPPNSLPSRFSHCFSSTIC